MHDVVGNRGTRTFGDCIAGAQNPRRPYVVALEHGGGGERYQRVHEGELVLERLDVSEAFPHECDRLIRTPAPHREDRTNPQAVTQEPRGIVSKRGRRLIEEA